MNTTGKLIFALVITANVTAVVTVSAVSRRIHQAQETQVIQLRKIVVTPAKAEPAATQLGAIVVTPTEADWRYAEAYGVNRPMAASVALAPIVVRPTAAQLAELAATQMAGSASATATAEDAAVASLMEALQAFSPGQYLDSHASLRMLNALVFDGQGR